MLADKQYTVTQIVRWLSGLGFMALSLSAQALVVLQYHHISEDTPKVTSTAPALFEAHLDYLQEHNFDVIGLDKLAALIRAGEPLPDKTAVITFDDGYSSVYEEAYPRLKKRGLPFAVFINTQPHNSGNPNFMSWEQMQEMAQSGAVFANHTVSHPHLIRRVEGESQEAWLARVWDEIKTAEETIQAKLGQHHKILAYPYGEYSLPLQELLENKGYLAFGQHSGPISQNSDKQALPRFPFGGVYGEMKSFTTKVNTLPMPIEGVTITSETGEELVEPELPQGVSRPRLKITLQQEGLAQKVNCFASGQGKISVQTTGMSVFAQADEALPTGRSRYNCTAPSGQAGRFYWYSQLFIRRAPDGSWYAE